MKTFKRLMCIILLAFLGSAIGYIVYTGSRLASFPAEECYKNRVFISSDGTAEIEFNDLSDSVYTRDGVPINISLTEYKDGVLVFTGAGCEYRFIALSENEVFDTDSRKVLYGT